MSSFYGNGGGGPSEEAIEKIITDYVAEHPELIGVEDGSITAAKLSTDVNNTINGKQDMLTFDSTPTAGSTNPVTSDGIKQAIDEKEINVDTAMSGTSTNPVQNKVITQEITGIRDDLSDKINSTYMTESASGSIVKFSDGADDIPMEEVRVNFSPIQNLNGYDHPWIGGAGKNLYDNQWMNKGTASSITCSGNSVHIVTDGSTRYMGTGMTSDHDIHGDGSTYYVKFKVKANPTVSSYSRFALRKRSDNVILNSRTITAATSDASYSFSVAATEDFYVSFIGNDTNIGSEYATDITIYDIMVSTTDSAFEPYSNICPITGRTGVNVEQNGKNLFASGWEQGTISSSGVENDSTTVIRTKDYIPVKPNENISIYRTIATAFTAVRGYDKNKQFIGYGESVIVLVRGGSPAQPMGTQNSCVIRPLEGVYYLRFIDNSNDLSTKYTMVFGSTPDTEYTGPTSKHHAITWETEAGEVFGGYVDAVKGKLAAEWKGFKIKDKTWTYDATYTRFSVGLSDSKIETTRTQKLYCSAFQNYATGGGIASVPDYSIYNGGTNQVIYIKIPDYTDSASFVSAFGEETIVYPLATPIEYDIDSVEIKSLLGDNVMWSDGDTVEVDYRADTAKSVDSKIEEAKSQTVSISGTAPTITAAENTRYICGEVVSLSFTPSSSGVCEVIFTAGSTVPVITLPSTVKMPEWYEIEANHVYEISVLNGVYGAVMSWEV